MSRSSLNVGSQSRSKITGRFGIEASTVGSKVTSSRLKTVLKNRVIPFTNAQVEKLAKGETVRQIQQAAPPLKGKVASHSMHYERQADLIDWTADPSGVNKNKET